MAFKNIRAGDRVRYMAYNGLTLRNGKAVPEYMAKTGVAVGLLIYQEHVVLNTGGKHGRPQVVDSGNYISHKSKA